MPTVECKHVWQPLDRSNPNWYMCLKCARQISAPMLTALLKVEAEEAAYDATEFRDPPPVKYPMQIDVPDNIVQMIREAEATTWRERMTKMVEAYQTIINQLKLENEQLLAGQGIRWDRMAQSDDVLGITKEAVRKIRSE